MSEAEAPSVAATVGSASKRIGINLIALLVARVAVLALTFVHLHIVFGTLGPNGTGEFSFALTYATLFSAFATFGIQRLLVRDIARNPSIAWTYVWTSTGVVLVLSLLVCAAVSGSAFFLKDSPTVRYAIMLSAISWIFVWAVQAPFEALLTARERMGFVAIVYVVTAVLRVVAVYVVLAWAPTSAGAHGALAAGNLVGLALCIAFAIRVAGWERPKAQLRLAWSQFRECFPFFVAMVCSLVYFKSDVAVLDFITKNETVVGLYGATQRIIEPLMMIAGIWGTVVFPALCRFSVTSETNYSRLKASSIRLALFVAFPMGVGVACLAEPIMNLLAGDQFAQSVILLQLMCVITPFFFFNGVAQEVFYASHRNWFVVTAYAIAGVINVTLNLILIPRIGVLAVTVAAIAANFAISAIFLHAIRSEFGAMALFSLVAKTAMSCTFMAGAVYALRNAPLVVGVGVGAAIYLSLQWMFRTLNDEEGALVKGLIGAFGRRVNAWRAS